MRPLLQFWYHEDVRSSAITTMPALVSCAKKYATANNMDNAVVKQVTICRLLCAACVCAAQAMQSSARGGCGTAVTHDVRAAAKLAMAKVQAKQGSHQGLAHGSQGHGNHDCLACMCTQDRSCE